MAAVLGTHPTIHKDPPPLRYTGSMGATVVHIGRMHGDNVQVHSMLLALAKLSKLQAYC